MTNRPGVRARAMSFAALLQSGIGKFPHSAVTVIWALGLQSSYVTEASWQQWRAETEARAPPDQTVAACEASLLP